MRENMPYDKLVAGIVLATSRKPGQSYDEFLKERAAYFRPEKPADFSERETMPYYWARRIVNKPEEKALSFSHTFLGVRLECAQCHKHPFDQWTQDDFKQFTAFFTPVRFAVAPDGRRKALAMRKELGVDKLPGGRPSASSRSSPAKATVIPWQEVFISRTGPTARVPGPARRPRPRTGRPAGSSRPSCSAARSVALDSAKDDPRKPLDGLDAVEGQPLLRPGLHQPGLGQRFRPGDRQPARRHEPRQPARQRRLARLPGRGLHRPRLRHEVAAPRDHAEPDLSAELEGERDQPRSTRRTSAGPSSAGSRPRW